MSKKILSILLCAALLFAFPLLVSAASPDDGMVMISQTVMELDNGDIMTKTVWVGHDYARDTAVSEKWSSKINTRDPSGALRWSYEIGGTFTWDGITAVASDPYDSYTLGEGWACTSHSVWTSGPSVCGSASFQNASGETSKTHPVLTCSPTGDLL